MSNVIATMTPATAGTRLANGAGVLGLATPLLANAWGGAPSGFDAANLVLTMPSLLAPWRGTLEAMDANRFRDVAGAPLAAPFASGRVAVVRMHSQAVQRLAALANARYAPPGIVRQPRALPWFMVIRNFEWESSPWRVEAGDPLLANITLGGPVSFHDGRGLIVCPVAVAAMFADLMSVPAYAAIRGPAVGGSGTLAAIAAMANGMIAHLVDPHGTAFVPVIGGIQRSNANGSSAAPAPGPLVNWGPGQVIGPNGAAAPRVRIGLMDSGTMTAAPVAIPPLPAGVGLPRQFFRLCVVDLPFYLLGNRGSAAPIQGIEPDDGRMPVDLLPQVRDNVAINYLRDGIDTLARAGIVAERVTNAGDSLFFLVSPAIEQNVGYALTPATDRWPLAPPPANMAAAPLPSPRPDVASGLQVRWAGTNDIVLTFGEGKLPAGAHVRVYPQLFRKIAEIGDALSFVRGDGGAALVPFQSNAASPPPVPPVSVLLPNPFALASGQPRPADPTLTVDIVVTDRFGARAMWAGVQLAVATDADAMPPPDAFAIAGPNIIDAWPDWFISTARTPLFGIKSAGAGPASQATDLITIAKSLAIAIPPREGPRLPTMARFETIVVTGIQGGAPAGALRWEGVVTGGRWARETRCDLHALGNPGHPAGPDVHAPGVHVTGALGYDLAVHALKHALPILPFPDFKTDLGVTPSWMMFLIGANMRPPVDAPAPGATGSGAVLTTVAAGVETPELALVALPQGPGPYTLQQLGTDITNALKPAPITVTFPPPTPDGDRVVNDVRREMFIAHNGIRDAVWSLRRAVRQARELIYVEGPAFGPTAYEGDPAGFPDLIGELAQSLSQHSALRVIVAVSRETDFSGTYQGFVRQALAARAKAVKALGDQFPGRIAAFHPVGFPGRAAALRTTCVVVDDVWSLVGTSHWRRRGMTFDGAVDIASFDRNFDQGYSVRVRAFRRATMAAKLGMAMPAAGTAATADWIRLGRPGSAFDLVADMLAQGGLGRIEALWPGPTDDSVLASGPEIVDPNGMNGAGPAIAIAALLNQIGAAP